VSSSEGNSSSSVAEGAEAVPSIDFGALAQEALSRWKADSPSSIGIDTETSGVAFFDPAFCVTVAWDSDEGDYTGHYLELVSEDAFEACREILLGTENWVFHNAKFDLQKLILAGVITREEVDGVYIQDTEAMAHLIDPNADKKLKRLAMDYLDWDDTITVEKKNGEGTYEVSAEKYALDTARRKLKLKKEDGYAVLPRDVLIPYAIADALMTIELYDQLLPRLTSRAQALRELYAREMRLALVLLDIEAAGMRVDMDYVDSTIKQLTGTMYAQSERIKSLTGEAEFKDHHVWIKRVLLDLGLKVDNVQADTLEELDHPVVVAILEWRKTKKMYDYFHAIQTEQRYSILHPSFRQHGTKTGRMSSGQYNSD
jgi:DNA polymerase I-like protein with 3'-5' exonuclease and polymerase domains